MALGSLLWCLFLCFILYQHFRERLSGGASYPLAVLLILRFRFIVLLRHARRIWILQFVLRAWTEGWNLMKVLWFDSDLFWHILEPIIRQVSRWPPR
jgi:hypothetical protein